MLIKNIRWDTDGDMEALASLPTDVYTPPFLHDGLRLAQLVPSGRH